MHIDCPHIIHITGSQVTTQIFHTQVDLKNAHTQIHFFLVHVKVSINLYKISI